jgi:sugar phosphate isomerase/epimerase
MTTEAESTGLPFSTPVRRKPLSVKRAEQKARRALTYGQRIEAAAEMGSAQVAVVQFDWARASFKRLDGPAAERAWLALTEAITRVREEHAQ